MSASVTPNTSSGKRRTSMSSTASGTSRGGGDIDDTSRTSTDMDYQPDLKKRKTIKLDPVEQCQQLYDVIRNHKKEDGTVLCEPFIRIPKRRQEPAYYEVVSNPMGMLQIQQKIRMDEYADIEQMSADVDLLVSNAKAFYKKSAPEYKDACDLWEIFVETKNKLYDTDLPNTEEGQPKRIVLKMSNLTRRAAAHEKRKPVAGGEDGETSESSTNTEKDRQDDDKDNQLFNQLEDMFSAIMSATDIDSRHLHTDFQLLPSKRIYPEYYEVIENPIDLKMIAIKIQSGEYGGLQELERDVLTMCKNACSFNEPGSQIYKDAKALKKIVSTKRVEVEQGRYSSFGSYGHGKTSERIRNRRNKSSSSLSAITAALQYEDDIEGSDEEQIFDEDDQEDQEDDDLGEEEEDEESKCGDTENPMWILYETVCSYKGATGKSISDPFKRLPSRRYYPDYYKEIKNPISLAQVKMRIKRGEYTNFTNVQSDLNVMFENAKAYNRPESSLFKWAVKLQKVMQTKVEELLQVDDDDNSNFETSFKGSKIEYDIAGHNSPPLLDVSTSSKDSWPRSPQKKNLFNKGKFNTKDDSPGSANLKGKEINRVNSAKELLKARFMALYTTLMESPDVDGRNPITVFIEKPSKKLYPDYYKVITEPIDMLTIEQNIKNDKYVSTGDLLKDFSLMFKNCRTYNEEGSIIYEDANRLEKRLYEKMNQLGPDPGKLKKKLKKNPMLVPKLKRLLDAVTEYKDKNGRLLSAIFQKLPSRAEYPGYYEIIKSPIDLDRICNKVKTFCYETLDELLADLMQMFDNACKFNEPDSQLYKDALVLQRLALQTKLTLAEEDDNIPDVSGKVREILTSIFTSLYNHQDEEGRCFTDTLAELPEFDEVDGQKVRAISLDAIKNRLDRGYYRRLDAFQKDMFMCFERARFQSRTDSQVFEDSVELQSFFIRTRDEACGFGSVLRSPALNYTRTDLVNSVEKIREEKKAKEAPQEEDVNLCEVKKEENSILQISQSETFNDNTFTIGDFVYVSASSGGSGRDLLANSNQSNNSLKPNIANIQKMWTEPDGTKMFEGIWFFRQDQTYHLPTRKFLEKEVFRSEVRSTAKLSEITGKCWVMTVKGKEYFNFAPEGYSDEDIYVCEYRYSSRGRSFTKLKSWAFGSDRINLIPRKNILEPVRVASVFSDRVSNFSEDLPVEMEEAPSEEFDNVVLNANADNQADVIFFEQYCLPFGPVRAGDYVYVRVEDAKKLIARVDTMWSTKEGDIFFHGPWFTSLDEISPTSFTPGQTFYKQEIFQSSIEDTNPLLSICGRCFVLEIDDYIKLRPTEIKEEDVYLCQSMYEEARRQITKFEGLKKVAHISSMVYQDEIYMFQKPIILVRITADGNEIQDAPPAIKLNYKAESVRPTIPGLDMKVEQDSLMDDSLDGPPSLSSETTSILGSSTPSLPTAKKKLKSGKKIVTGYILYSSEVRKSISEQNPTCTFGEISRIVGNQWRKKSPLEKQPYEEKASNLNKEKGLTGNGHDPTGRGYGKNVDTSKQELDLIGQTNALKKDPDWIFECGWAHCDWQFEDALDLIEHCAHEPQGHVAKTFQNAKPAYKEGEFQCQWKNCARLKKDAKPFPNLPRLLKHVKDIHILKGNGRIIHPDMRSKNFAASRISKPKPRPGGNKKSGTISIPQSMNDQAFVMPTSTLSFGSFAAPVLPPPQPIQLPPPPPIVKPAPPPESLFVPVPPRPQKLLHSEAYIRYIESLHNKEQRYMTNWEKALNATPENTTVTEPEKLPTHWVANNASTQEAAVTALWNLRNFMMRDALNLRRVLE